MCDNRIGMRLIILESPYAGDIEANGGLPADVSFFAKPVHFGQLEELVRTSFETQPA